MPTSRRFLVIIMGGVILGTLATMRLKTRIFHQPTRYLLVSSSWNLTIWKYCLVHVISDCRRDYERHRWLDLWTCLSTCWWKFYRCWNGRTFFVSGRFVSLIKKFPHETDPFVRHVSACAMPHWLDPSGLVSFNGILLLHNLDHSRPKNRLTCTRTAS